MTPAERGEQRASWANGEKWPSPVQTPLEGLDRPCEVDDATTRNP
jgi:hypothetical protein